MRTNITLYTLLVACDTKSISLGNETAMTDTASDTAATPLPLTARVEVSYDLLIKEGDPERNFEYWTIPLGADYDGAERGLYYFDVTAYAGRTLATATMRIYALSAICQSATTGKCTDSNGDPFELAIGVYELTSPWITDTLTITWDSELSYNPKKYDTQRFNHTQEQLASYDEHEAVFPYDFDITPLAQYWIDTRENYGVLLRANDSGEQTGSSQLDCNTGSLDSKYEPGAPAALTLRFVE